MKLLVIILKDESLLDRISSILVEVGLFDSSVLDGEGVETLMEGAQPVFASFKDLFGRGYMYNRTIVSPVQDPQAIPDFLRVCQQEQIDLANPEVGVLFTLPCTIFDGANGDQL